MVILIPLLITLLQIAKCQDTAISGAEKPLDTHNLILL